MMADTWNRPEPIIKGCQPFQKLLKFGERHVIQKRVTAINESRDATAFNVPNNQIILRQIERTT